MNVLVDLARSAVPVCHEVTARMQMLARGAGVDVVDVRPPGLDGVWEVRFRLPDPPLPTSLAPVPDLVTGPPQSEFVSPVPGSAPFVGDGTGDLLAFAARADPSVCVPRFGEGAPELPRPLDVEERCRMLALTIAGDIALRLVHEGRVSDSEAVTLALEEGRGSYEAELVRSGLVLNPNAYDAACSFAQAHLLGIS